MHSSTYKYSTHPPHHKLLSLYAGQSVNQLLQGGQLLLVNQLKLLDEVHKVLEGGVELRWVSSPSDTISWSIKIYCKENLYNIYEQP